MKDYKCIYCGCHFTSKKADKNRTPKYCSKKCFSLDLKKINSEKEKIQITEKKCSKCKEVKPISDFYKSKKENNGIRSECKCCTTKYSDTIKEQKSKYDKKYRLENKDRIVQNKKEYSLRKRKEINKYHRQYMKAYRVENKSMLFERDSKYSKEYRKTYYAENKKNIHEKSRLYNLKMYRTDINYNLRVRLRSRIKGVIKKHGGEKANKTYDLLGCGYDEFITYFTDKFTNGMTWDKFMNGEIHIDHIKPCILFDLTDINQQKECFNYSNLQPLWGKDNLIKGKKYGIR